MKKIALFSVISLLTLQVSAQNKFPGYQQSWPKATPESQGMSTELLEKARSLMRTDDGKEFQAVDAIIIRNGYDVWHIGNPYEVRKGNKFQKDWASCGRSLMTTMFGMIFQENNLPASELEKPAREVFFSYTAKELDSTILASHLLGYAACGAPSGSRWDYACHYFTMHRIVRDIDGCNPAERIKKLAKQIDADWQPFEYWGHKLETPFLTIVASEQEAARWGYLWLNKGNWNGTQIVGRDFVDYSLLPVKSPLGGYAHSNEGLQIHLNLHGMWGNKIPADAYAAFGAGGKIIFVCPSMNMVAAITIDPSPYQRREVNGEIHRSIQYLMEPFIDAVIK